VKKLNINFLGYGDNEQSYLNPNLSNWYTDNIFLFLLKKKYDVSLVKDNPDILIYTLVNNNHLNFNNCVKIFHTEEPGFWNKSNYFEYYSSHDRFGLSAQDANLVLSSYYIDNENNFRFPSFLLYYYQMILDGRIPCFDFFFNDRKITDESLFDRKFCCYIHRNNRQDMFRVKFLEKLSKYKKVDIIENIPGHSYEKTEFVKKNYKFCFGMENNSQDINYYPNIKNSNYVDIGYTTEKIIEPFCSNTIPLYWGNPLIKNDFNNDMFINWHDYKNDELMIEKIIEIDNDKEKYFSYLNGTVFNKNKIEEILNNFIKKIESLIT
jgi:hypothetical protein